MPPLNTDPESGFANPFSHAPVILAAMLWLEADAGAGEKCGAGERASSMLHDSRRELASDPHGPAFRAPLGYTSDSQATATSSGLPGQYPLVLSFSASCRDREGECSDRESLSRIVRSAAVGWKDGEDEAGLDGSARGLNQ